MARETDWQRKTRQLEQRIIRLFPKLCYFDLQSVERFTRKKAQATSDHAAMLREIQDVRGRWKRKARKKPVKRSRKAVA